MVYQLSFIPADTSQTPVSTDDIRNHDHESCFWSLDMLFQFHSMFFFLSPRKVATDDGNIVRNVFGLTIHKLESAEVLFLPLINLLVFDFVSIIKWLVKVTGTAIVIKW